MSANIRMQPFAWLTARAALSPLETLNGATQVPKPNRGG